MSGKALDPDTDGEYWSALNVKLNEDWLTGVTVAMMQGLPSGEQLSCCTMQVALVQSALPWHCPAPG